MIIIPIPHNQQEENAGYIKKHDAAIILDQEKVTNQDFIKKIKDLLSDKSSLYNLGQKGSDVVPANAAQTLSDEILKMI